MNTKLTLTIEKEVIERAKKYARSSGRSLSDLIESYLNRITSQDHKRSEPDIDELFGVIELPPDFDEKKAVREIVINKHGK